MDLTGQRYGKLTATFFAGKNKHGQTQWLCRCDCGYKTVVTTGHLRSGHTKSCGCAAIETARKNHTTHGMGKTRLYRIWSNIKSRCENPGSSVYERYGGRGITVCDEWRDSFQSFKDWAEENGYKDNLTIDRIDNNGEYSPENCRWATPKEQGNNKRNNHLIEINGETKTLSQWCDLYGLSSDLVKQRINKLGWSPLMAFTTPIGGRRGRHERTV